MKSLTILTMIVISLVGCKSQVIHENDLLLSNLCNPDEPISWQGCVQNAVDSAFQMKVELIIDVETPDSIELLIIPIDFGWSDINIKNIKGLKIKKKAYTDRH